MPQGRVGHTDHETFVRPIRALGRTALISGALSLVPVFAVLLWLSIGSSPWPFVAGAELLVTASFFTVYIRFRLVFTAVTPTHFVKRRMLLSRVVVERALVDRVIMSRVYRAGTTDALLQLLAIDANGCRLFAMSELFWSPTSIRSVRDALGIPTSTIRVPISRREYYRRFPVARTWYAGRVVVVTSGAVIVAAMVAIVMALEALYRSS
ncbi:MAG: hypothetical protein JWP75_3496 [Frondihabitans sp.]|nr:hypothetical protein [Frondihabitans sp.]